MQVEDGRDLRAWARQSQAAFIGVLLGLAVLPWTQAQADPPFERTEQRADCDSYDDLRQAFFGDTHAHTSYSFNAYSLSVRNDPDAAYMFAKGEASVMLPDASARGGAPQTRTVEIDRPLDFLAITDHSELLGEIQICTRSAIGTPGRSSFQCRQIRTGELIPGAPFDTFNPTAVTALWALNPITRVNGAGPVQPLCSLPGVDCDAAAVSLWQDIQQAAEDHYDRESTCNFTTFVAYEYTAQPLARNLHRNVIFRNAVVPDSAISNVSTGGPFLPILWQLLRDECVDAGTGCDVLTIPHNANLAGGLMFPDPESIEEAAERAFFEPITEMYQHKGSSECRYDRLAGLGVDTTDPLCTFEQLPASILGPQPNIPDIDEFPRRNLVRNVLKDGLALAPILDGVNPFKLGFVSATDTHNGDPGNAVEIGFPGHVGTEDAPVAPLLSLIRLSPGGLAVVWAEENSRDAIFAAMRRKETYGTSGTRPIVRFFGGWEFETYGQALCENPDRIQIGYDSGVPMGGDLPLPAGSNPSFLVAALKDPENADLDRIQIVKGWVDALGDTHERVYDVAGNTGTYGSEAGLEVCGGKSMHHKYGRSGGFPWKLNKMFGKSEAWETAPYMPASGSIPGFGELCTVWTDGDFDPAESAFYYVRVLETPTCRWSTPACRAAGVDPFASPRRCRRQASAANFAAAFRGEIQFGETPFDNCCLTEQNDSFFERSIQERAWTSPIWYGPES